MSSLLFFLVDEYPTSRPFALLLDADISRTFSSRDEDDAAAARGMKRDMHTLENAQHIYATVISKIRIGMVHQNRVMSYY